MDALIDPVTTPFSSVDEIEAEIAEIERLEDTPARAETLEQMRGWLQLKKEAGLG